MLLDYKSEHSTPNMGAARLFLKYVYKNFVCAKEIICRLINLNSRAPFGVVSLVQRARAWARPFPAQSWRKSPGPVLSRPIILLSEKRAARLCVIRPSLAIRMIALCC